MNRDEKQVETAKTGMSAFKKNLIAGAICFVLGATCAGSICGAMMKNQSKRNASLYARIHEEQQKVKEAEKNIKTVYVTVPVPVTESIQTTKEAAPVTETPETESTVDVSETETANEISEDDVRALINPLTKAAAAPYQAKISSSWTVYWIEVKRSDLFGLKPDDFKFFNDYINKHFEADKCDFYMIVSDVPDLCFQFNVTDNSYIQSLGEVYLGIRKTDDNYPSSYPESCIITFKDAEQFEIQGLRKDEYNLPQYDDDKIYHYSEFNDDMFAKLNELQKDALKLFG